MDDFDYLLCGIHDLRFDGLPAVYFVPERGAELLEAHGEEKIHREYLKKMRSIIETGYFDILTHFDNQRLLWLPDEPAYPPDIWCELLDLLDLVKAQGMAVEINTMGTRKKCNSQFPCDDIVRELIKREIPLTLCSDAHKPGDIAYEFEDFLGKARPWGLTHLCSYENRKQRLVPVR